MAKFSGQSKDFDYAFVFNQGETIKNWEFHLTNESSTSDGWASPSGIQVISGEEGSSEAINYHNGYLALSNQDSGNVNIYISETDIYGTPSGNFNQLNRATGNGLSVKSGFGASLAITDQYVFVGSPNATETTGAGAVFSYASFITGGIGSTGNGGFSQAGLVTGTGLSGAFGCSISASQLGVSVTLGVGATGENNASGKVYLYRGGNLSLINSIDPSGENINKFGKTQTFGRFVSNQGYLVVGCEEGQTGQVHIYKESSAGQNDYEFFQKFQSPEAHAGDGYGSSVYAQEITPSTSLSIGAFMVGAPNLGTTGKAYFYKFNNSLGIFELNQTLSSSSPSANEHFGKSCAFNLLTEIQNSNQTGIAVIASDLNKGKGYIYSNQTIGESSSWLETGIVTGKYETVNGSFGGFSSGNQATEVTRDGRVIVGSVDSDFAYSFVQANAISSSYTGVSFSGNNGKLYDSEGKFIYGYGLSNLFQISGGVFTGGYYNLYVNGNLCRSRAPRTAGIGFTGSLNSWSATGITSGLEYTALNIIN